MSGLSWLLGALVGLALYAWLRSGRRYRRITLAQNAALLAIAGVAAVATAGAVILATRDPAGREEPGTDVEAALDELRQTPFLRTILEDVPEAEEQLRSAVRRTLGQPEADDTPSALEIGHSLSVRYGLPALRAASDAQIMDLWDANARTLRWLSEHDPEGCSAFVLGGSFDPAALGAEFRTVFRDHLMAAERAYLDGRGKPPGAMVDDETFLALVRDRIGFAEADFAVLAEPSPTTARQICDLGLRLTSSLDRIPEADRAGFARHVLASPD